MCALRPTCSASSRDPRRRRLVAESPIPRLPGKHDVSAADARALEAAIDLDELTALVLALCNIPAPVGHEQQAGQFVHDSLGAAGFSARKVGLVEHRFNVISRFCRLAHRPSPLFTGRLDAQYPPY